MRIDYTLPALAAGTQLNGDQLVAGTQVSFRDQLRGATITLPTSTEQVLHLDVIPMNATNLAPPPRPHTLEMRDAESERARWRNMLLHHTRSVTGGTLSDPRGRRAVDTMFAMLLQMQQMEDGIISRNAAITRG